MSDRALYGSWEWSTVTAGPVDEVPLDKIVRFEFNPENFRIGVVWVDDGDQRMLFSDLYPSPLSVELVEGLNKLLEAGD